MLEFVISLVVVYNLVADISNQYAAEGIEVLMGQSVTIQDH